MSSLRILAGSANPRLAAAIGALLDIEPIDCAPEVFPDGELRPAVQHVCGKDVFVVQPTSPPVNDHLVELLLTLDACRRAGAGRVTAVVPYFGYARQSRRTHAGAALGLRVAAEAIARAGADRLVVVDPHTDILEAVCPIPVEILSAVPMLAGKAGAAPGQDTVVVAPDLGAARLAEGYAAVLREPVAIVRKHRENGTNVTALELLGNVSGRSALIVDDMIATGATIEAAVDVLRFHVSDMVVAVTHGPLVAGAAERVRGLGVRRVLVTDSVAHPIDDGAAEVYSLAPLLADAIARLHHHQPLGEALTRV